MKALLALLTAVAAAVTFSACTPPPSEFIPDPDRFWKVIQTTIQAAINQVIGTSPDNPNIDCSVVLFDGAIDPATFKTQWTPVHKPAPELFPAWFTACFGPARGRHIVPTFLASGRPNSPGQPNQAVCWVTSPVPNGSMIFDCGFDRVLPQLAWVPYVAARGGGYLAVGSLG